MSKITRQRIMYIYAALAYIAAICLTLWNNANPGTVSRTGKLSFTARAELYLAVSLLVFVAMVAYGVYRLLRDGQEPLGPKGYAATRFWCLFVLFVLLALAWPVTLVVLGVVWGGKLLPPGLVAPYGEEPPGSPPGGGVSPAPPSGGRPPRSPRYGHAAT